MRKTSVYLSDREIERLERMSRALGRPQAQIVREAIAAYVPMPPDDDFALFSSGNGPGDSISDVDERELLDGFGE